MKQNNSQGLILITVIIILAAGLGIYMLSGQANRISKQLTANNRHANTEELAATLDDNDYMVYYLGTPTDEMSLISEHVTLITENQVTGDYLPIKWSEIHVSAYDSEDNKIDEVEPRDYANLMAIIVDEGFVLTPEDLEVLRNCAVENGVPLLIIGQDNIDAFRSLLLLAPHDYGADGSMLFMDGTATSGPVFEGGDSRSKTDTIFEFLIDTFGLNEQEVTEDGN